LNKESGGAVSFFCSDSFFGGRRGAAAGTVFRRQAKRARRNVERNQVSLGLDERTEEESCLNRNAY
jgi:hypothetical protein